MRFYVPLGFSSLWRCVLAEHERQVLRHDKLYDVHAPCKRHGDLRRRHMRLRMQQRQPRLCGAVCIEYRRRDMWCQLFALQPTKPRDRDLQWHELRFQLQCWLRSQWLKMHRGLHHGELRIRPILCAERPLPVGVRDDLCVRFIERLQPD